jgi:hypothetical protein
LHPQHVHIANFLYKINCENVENKKCVHAWANGTSYIGIFDFHKQKKRTKHKDYKKNVYTSFVLNANTIEPSKSVTSNLNKTCTLKHVHTTQIGVQHFLIVINKPFEAHMCLFQSIATSLKYGLVD